jgi:hypothetical protein
MQIPIPLTVSVLKTDSGEECERVLPTIFLYADRESVGSYHLHSARAKKVNVCGFTPPPVRWFS